MMDEKRAKEIVDYTFKDIFGRVNPFTLDQIREKFAFDIPLPFKVKDTVTGKDAWIVKSIGKKVRVWEEWGALESKGDGMVQKEKIRDIDDLLEKFDNIFYNVADKAWEAKDYAATDNIYLANDIYYSYKVIRSQSSAFSAEILDSKYLVACYYTDSSTAAIRAMDSSFCTSSFGISWSGKISKCMYLSNCKDMYECMFCANLHSRKYCIANMQFTKEEYMPIKEMVIDWTIENFKKGKSLGV